MKKIVWTMLAVLTAAVLTACGGNEENAKPEDKNTGKQEEKSQEASMKEMQEKLDKQKVDEKETVAVVNDDKILGKDFNGMLQNAQMSYQMSGQDPTTKEASEQIKQQTIDSLVGQSLIMQEAAEKGYKASEEEVQGQLDEIKKQYEGDDKKFAAALKDAGLTEEELKGQISDSIVSNKYIDKEIKADAATEEEVKAYYEQVKASTPEGQSIPEYEEVKTKIQEQLNDQKKQEVLVKQVENLKKDAKVEVLI
ncbi:SurA N-terminal domain-containing protein [Bacillus infantis]|uniref:SurA N-terminal domain-containing protein n=1 Tax=Bacillus infantis TaxID=324767 RepID=UPI001CD64E45|nr:SurA N-terminal domain-containing protein [Bacillus infantis]MCA1039249.1 SurA N-terminal domain-containing protein [Bacillus infantis]